MIIVLRSELFEGEETDDLALLVILGAERERHKVRLQPAYRPQGDAAFHRWLARQGSQIQSQVRIVLEQGLKEWDFSIPGGEPKIIVERRAAPEWPDSFSKGPIKLPLGIARVIVTHPLELLLENGLNDWGFLEKIVPTAWKGRWARAVENRWIQSKNAGGITGIPSIVERQLADDSARRLRTWVMFDCDGRAEGHRSTQAEAALEACLGWHVSHHALERRAIENYLPKVTLFDWVRRRRRGERSEKSASVEAYLALTPAQRHHYNVKDGFEQDRKSESMLKADVRAKVSALYPEPLTDPRGPLWGGIHPLIGQDVWGADPDKNPYVIPENAFDGDQQFEAERTKIFQAIFGML